MSSRGLGLADAETAVWERDDSGGGVSVFSNFGLDALVRGASPSMSPSSSWPSPPSLLLPLCFEMLFFLLDSPSPLPSLLKRKKRI